VDTDRRLLLRRAAAAAGTLWLPRSAFGQPRLTDDPFTLGVASGSPRSDGVVLWTRLHSTNLFGRSTLPDEAITVRWEVAHDEGFKRIVLDGQAQALPELAHSVHAEVDGLEPARSYHYRFRIGGRGNDWTSPTGRTRTLPAADATPAQVRLAYASCQRWEHGWFAAWRHLVADEPDAVLFLGDYLYEYPGAPDPVRSHDLGWALTLGDYRRRYALYRSDADLRAAHAACPWFMTWDDHEVQNDYAGLLAGDGGPAVADFAQRRAAAYQAWYEHMPARASVLARGLGGSGAGGEMRVYGSARLGSLATLYLLDARQHRSAQACTRDGKAGSSTVNPDACAAWNDPARTMLGHAQEQWLREAFASQASAGGWNLIGQSTLFCPRDVKPGAGRSLWNDGWDGYAPARQRLIDALRAERVSNPVLLGGDVHENWVGHVRADDADRANGVAVGVEFCGTSITSRSGGGSARVAERLAENPHFVFADAQRKGYGLVDLAPQRIEVALRVVDDVASRHARIETLAAFRVAAGQPLVERV
jgi:alkaline phosphatase D